MSSRRMKGNRKIDKRAIEQHYSAGVHSNRQIAAANGCSESYVRKLASENAWQKRSLDTVEDVVASHRDLAEKIRERLARIDAFVDRAIDAVHHGAPTKVFSHALYLLHYFIRLASVLMRIERHIYGLRGADYRPSAQEMEEQIQKCALPPKRMAVASTSVHTEGVLQPA